MSERQPTARDDEKHIRRALSEALIHNDVVQVEVAGRSVPCRVRSLEGDGRRASVTLELVWGRQA